MKFSTKEEEEQYHEDGDFYMEEQNRHEECERVIKQYSLLGYMERVLILVDSK